MVLSTFRVDLPTNIKAHRKRRGIVEIREAEDNRRTETTKSVK